MDFEQMQLPPELWQWDRQARPRPLPVHPSISTQPRVLAVHDGGGEGDGVPCGQLSLVP